MSRNLKKYVTPLLAAAAATVAIAAAPRLSQQITSPATGVAREPSANLPATLSSRLLRRTFSSTPTETSPGCSSTTEQVRGTGYHILVATFGGEDVAPLVAKLVVNRPISLIPTAVLVA